MQSRRVWLVGVILAVTAIGVWYSMNRRASVPPSAIDLNDGRSKLIELGMGVCGQCQRMQSVMEQAAHTLDDVLDVRMLDIRHESNAQLAERYQLRVMPTVLLIDGAGRELWRHEGYIAFPELHRQIEEGLR